MIHFSESLPEKTTFFCPRERVYQFEAANIPVLTYYSGVNHFAKLLSFVRWFVPLVVLLISGSRVILSDVSWFARAYPLTFWIISRTKLFRNVAFFYWNGVSELLRTTSRYGSHGSNLLHQSCRKWVTSLGKYHIYPSVSYYYFSPMPLSQSVIRRRRSDYVGYRPEARCDTPFLLSYVGMLYEISEIEALWGIRKFEHLVQFATNKLYESKLSALQAFFDEAQASLNLKLDYPHAYGEIRHRMLSYLWRTAFLHYVYRYACQPIVICGINSDCSTAKALFYSTKPGCPSSTLMPTVSHGEFVRISRSSEYCLDFGSKSFSSIYYPRRQLLSGIGACVIPLPLPLNRRFIPGTLFVADLLHACR